MNGFDEEQPGGIAGLDWPISLYDRPTLAFSNLLMRGDIDAATRAMLSPQTLTPTELQTFRSRLLKGKKPSPIMKTILDITTSPIAIMGLALAIAYPIAGVKPLHALFTGAAGSVSKVGPYLSWTNSAFTNLRNKPGFIRLLVDYVRSTRKFMDVHGAKMAKIIQKNALTSQDEIDAFMLAEGWHKKGAWMGKIVPGADKIGPLAPGLDKVASPAARELAKGMRGWFDGIIKQFPKDYTKQWMTMWSELQLKGTQLRGTIAKMTKPGGRIWEDYVAHIIAPYDRYTAAGVRRSLNTLRAGERAVWLDQMVKYNVSPNLLKRGLSTITNLEQLQMADTAGRLNPKFMPLLKQWMAEGNKRFVSELGGVWSQHGNTKGFLEKAWLMLSKGPWQMEAGKKLRPRTPIHNALVNIRNRLAGAETPQALQKEIQTVADLFATPAQYTMLPTEILPKYLKTIAPTWAWHIKGFGPQITKVSNTLEGWQSTYVKDQIVPLLRGFKTWKGTLRATAFGEQKHRIYSWFKGHKLFDPPFPQSTRKWLTDYFSGISAGGGIESLSSDVAHYFYLSTLGFPNLSPTLKNTGQTWITTANVVGLRGMKLGMAKLLPKWGKYLGLKGKGMPWEKAFKKAFPEFVRAEGIPRNIMDEVVAGGKPSKIMLGKFGKKLMMPFQTSELFLNRLLSFYAAHETALADGMTSQAAKEVGGVMMRATQFPGGPLNMPKAILDLSPAFRQFMHFPMRFAGFLSSSARWGANPNIRHYGTLGRAMMGSTAAYYGAKNVLGTDISQGLLWGALPGPTFEGSPFHPAPFVPPIIGIAGGIGAAIHTGESKYLQSMLPLLVPGGLGIRRMYRTLAPRYADYENRTEEGRIPIYNRKNALVGTYSPFELFMRSIGIMPSTQTAERGAAQWLLTQRDKIRRYRNEYIQALFTNDLKKAESINREFQDQYPELGPITLKKSDITALRNRRETSRLGRILRGFPKAYRPLFETAASEAMLGNMMGDLERQPESMGYYSNLFANPAR